MVTSFRILHRKKIICEDSLHVIEVVVVVSVIPLHQTRSNFHFSSVLGVFLGTVLVDSSVNLLTLTEIYRIKTESNFQTLEEFIYCCQKRLR